jgi:pimeloyl-ACP methyl ester carboxylesterase
MATATATASDLITKVGDLQIRALDGGSGTPLVVLHHSTGNVGWSPFHEALAQSHRVLAVDIPGFGQSTRPDWAREPRDLAILLNQWMDKLGLEDVTLVGAGFGGWLAAEMAAMNESRLGALVLLGPAGLRPREGRILDQIMVDFSEYMRAGFKDEALYDEIFGERPPDAVRELWDFSREMIARVTWKPYMFSRRLKPLLPEISTPTLVLWADSDVIIPRDCAEQYAETIPNARLQIIENAGHLAELEHPEAVATLVSQFARAAAH